jgi:hypothetical protein
MIIVLTVEETIRPTLPEPFPNMPDYWTDPITGLSIPKREQENIEWRRNLLQRAEKDIILQNDLRAASKESLLFWVNAFTWTYHQFDVDPFTGKRVDAVNTHVPFVTWEIQDELFDAFKNCIKIGEDILSDKSRDMGASWCCVGFLHWLWLFMLDKQLLELSRTEPYVDQPGNMKALFQKHDYINNWLPAWMLPPQCLYGEKNRTKMHMANITTGSVLDGESTTQHAASGDRRFVTLLDEFAKVEKGQLMRSATRDASYVRIINSTPAGPGTEYSRWKKSGQIKVFVLPFWEHPDKGKGRYIKETDVGGHEIRSPWFNEEEKVRSPKELAREVLMQDIESGDVFFTTHNIDKHIAIYARESKTCWNIEFKKEITKEAVRDIIRKRDLGSVFCRRAKSGKLRIWTNLILNRPDQSKSYVFGIDLSKGQGASNSVISIKCKETGEKIAEWKDANTPPYDMPYIVAALAIWCGGCQPRKLPFIKWENNGPGWDFGKIIVKELFYPYYYKHERTGTVSTKKTDSYGFHMERQNKFELLSLYDRLLAHGGYINHSREGLEEAKMYIHYNDGGIGPAGLVEESSSARKTHGDIVIADALTLDDKDLPKMKIPEDTIPRNSTGYRFRKAINAGKKNEKSWRKAFDFQRGVI